MAQGWWQEAKDYINRSIAVFQYLNNTSPRLATEPC
jgi:hypothetical protein